MTTATRAVREQGFEPVQCDIPAELTIEQYRSSRRAAVRRRREKDSRRRLAGLIRR
jgi:hypothetical protein